MKVGDKVLINKSMIEAHNGLTGEIRDIDVFEGDLEFMIETNVGFVMCYEGEFVEDTNENR